MLKPYTGSKTVVTAGTRVQLTAISSQEIFTSIVIQGTATNAGRVFVGGSNVSATNGVSLAAGEAVTFSGDWRRDGSDEFDITDFYIDAATNSDSVQIILIAKR